jgi:hypothetical protein
VDHKIVAANTQTVVNTFSISKLASFYLDRFVGYPTYKEYTKPHIENEREIRVIVFATDAVISPHTMTFISVCTFVAYVAVVR